MKEIKSGEYVIVAAGEGEDGYVFTQDLNEEVACAISLPYEEKIAVGRQLDSKQFISMLRDIIDLARKSKTKRLYMQLNFIGGKAIDGPNSSNPAVQYVNQVINLLLKLCGTGTEVKKISQPGKSDKLYIERESEKGTLIIKLMPSGLGNTPHPNSIIMCADVSAENGHLGSYDDWQYETYFGCGINTDEKREKARASRIKREREGYFRGKKMLDEHCAELAAEIKKNSATTASSSYSNVAPVPRNTSSSSSHFFSAPPQFKYPLPYPWEIGSNFNPNRTDNEQARAEPSEPVTTVIYKM